MRSTTSRTEAHILRNSGIAVAYFSTHTKLLFERNRCSPVKSKARCQHLPYIYVCLTHSRRNFAFHQNLSSSFELMQFKLLCIVISKSVCNHYSIYLSFFPKKLFFWFGNLHFHEIR